jgi:hypothetical protein
MIELLPLVKIADEPADKINVEGHTSSRVESEGERWSWALRAGESSLTVWQTFWRIGEHELVLAKHEVEASTPVIVLNLMARRRAPIELANDFEYMSARRVDPDSTGWPRFSNCSEYDLSSLIPAGAEKVIGMLGYRGSASRLKVFDATDRNRNQRVGLFHPGSHAAQVGFYVLSRIVPTLRQAGVV